MNYENEVSKAVNVLIEMLRDRGENTHGLEMFQRKDIKDFFSIVSGDIKVIFNIGPKVKGYFDDDEKSRKSQIAIPRYYIIVVFEKLNVRDIDNLNNAGKEYQLFNLYDLQFNIAQHILVPKHELINSDEEIEKLVILHKIKTKTQFPHLLRNDPMAKYVYAKPGNLVKVTRSSQTSCSHIVYRCVV